MHFTGLYRFQNASGGESSSSAARRETIFKRILSRRRARTGSISLNATERGRDEGKSRREKKGIGAANGMDFVRGRMEIHFALFARDIDTRRPLLKDTVRNFVP